MPRLVILLCACALTVIAPVPGVAQMKASWGGHSRAPVQLRLTSWAIWTADQAIGTVGALMTAQIASAAYTGACCAGCALIMWTGRRHGQWITGPLDKACATLAVAGLVLLALAAADPALLSPSASLVVSAATDLLGFLPTFASAWRYPSSEIRTTYILYGVGAALTLIATRQMTLTALAWPAYLAAADAAIIAIIAFSPHRTNRPTSPRGTPSCLAKVNGNIS